MGNASSASQSAAKNLGVIAERSMAAQMSIPPNGLVDCEQTCSVEAQACVLQKINQLLSCRLDSLAVLVLPGAFNPVHSEHLRSMELARDYLEQIGAAVVGAFLQPSSDEYVTSKVGPEWAMSLADRITACELAAAERAEQRNGELWIHAWRSGQTNGFAVPRRVADFLNAVVEQNRSDASPLQRRIQPYLVCGADLVTRCGGWSRPIMPPAIVIPRHEVVLPDEGMAEGWHIVFSGDRTEPVSSTQIREVIGQGRWQELAEVGCGVAVSQFMQARHDAGRLFIADSGHGRR